VVSPKAAAPSEVLLAACGRFEQYVSAMTATVAYCSPVREGSVTIKAL